MRLRPQLQAKSDLLGLGLLLQLCFVFDNLKQSASIYLNITPKRNNLNL